MKKVYRWWVARNVSLSQWREALVAVSELRWVYAERIEDLTLTWKMAWLSAQEIPLEAWHHGRAFGPQAEWMWWRREDGFWVRAVTEGEVRPDERLPWALFSAAEAWQPRAPLRYMLIGERVPLEEAQREGVPWPLWRSLRIRRNLVYPIEVPEGTQPPEHVVLEVRPFVTPQEYPVAVQWCRIKGENVP